MRRCVLLAGLLLAARPALAQEAPARLTLEDALRIARSNNPEYRQTLNDVDVAEAQVRRAWGGLLPDVSASLGFGGTETRSYTGIGDLGHPIVLPDPEVSTSSSASQGVSLSMTLFDGGSSLQRVREGRAAAREAGARVAAREVQLRADVATRFYAALRAEEAVRVEEQLLASARDQLSMTRRRFEINSARREDVLGSEAQVASQERVLDRARADALKAGLEFARVLGVPADTGFQLDGTLPPAFDPSVLDESRLVAVALETSPRIREREAAVAARERGASIARGARWPRVTLSASFNRSLYQREYAALFELNPLDRRMSVDLRAQLPLFTGFETSYGIAQADAAAQDAREQLRQERLALETEVRAALVDLRNAYRSLQLAERSLALSQERLELTQERYRTGGNVTFVDLQSAIDGAARAERDFIDAQFQYVSARINLESRVGREVGP